MADRDENGFLTEALTCIACNNPKKMRPQGSGIGANNTPYETFVCDACGHTERF